MSLKHYHVHKNNKHLVITSVITAMGIEFAIGTHHVHAANDKSTKTMAVSSINNINAKTISSISATINTTKITSQSSSNSSVSNSQSLKVNSTSSPVVSTAKKAAISSESLKSSKASTMSTTSTRISSSAFSTINNHFTKSSSSQASSQVVAVSAISAVSHNNKADNTNNITSAASVSAASIIPSSQSNSLTSASNVAVISAVAPVTSADNDLQHHSSLASSMHTVVKVNSVQGSQASLATSTTKSITTTTVSAASQQSSLALSLVSQQSIVKNVQNNVNHNDQQNNGIKRMNNTLAKAQVTNLISTAVLPLGDSDAPRMDAIDLSSNNNNGQTITVAQFEYMKSCGVKTIIIKLTEGTFYQWYGALADIRNAQEAGLNVAVYHFAHYNSYNSAINEANYFANVIDSYNLSKNITVVDDLEDPDTDVSNAAYYTQVFFNQLSNRGYHNHVLYTFVSYGQRANVVNVVGDSHVWMAQYPYTPSKNNLWNTQYGAWQFSATVTIPKLVGYFDATIDYDDIFSDVTPQQVYQNGHWYLEKNGQKLTGFQQVPGQNKTCYYDPNNGGAMVYGLQNINGSSYYFNTDSGAMSQNQFIWLPVEPGGQYGMTYFGDNGQMYKNGNYQIGNHWYHFDQYGAYATGLTTLDGYQYYYNPQNGWMAQNQFIWLPVEPDGKCGMTYFDQYGKMLKNGNYQIGNHWYHFDQYGAYATGLTTLDGYQYYYNPQNGWMAQNQFVWLPVEPDGKCGMTYFDQYGKMLKNGMYQIGSHWYYFDQYGAYATGLTNVNGIEHYFNPQTGWMAQNQFVWLPVEPGGRCGMTYFDNNGDMYQNGVYQIGNHWYYFNQYGAYATGLTNVNGVDHYYDPQTGWMVTNKFVWLPVEPDGKYGMTYFDNNGDMYRNGMYQIGSHWYYFNQYGAYLTGWQTIDGKQYYFDPHTGWLIPNE